MTVSPVVAWRSLEGRYGNQLDSIFKWGQRAAMLWLVGLSIYIVFEPAPVRYLNAPFPVLSARVFPGDPIVFAVQTESALEDPYTFKVDRWLQNVETGERQVLPPKDRTIMPGKHAPRNINDTFVPDDFLLPKCTVSLGACNNAPGRYLLCGSAQIDARVRNLKKKWCTQEFVIMKPGAPL